jgi:hypothetical protein
MSTSSCRRHSKDKDNCPDVPGGENGPGVRQLSYAGTDKSLQIVTTKKLPSFIKQMLKTVNNDGGRQSAIRILKEIQRTHKRG